MSYILDALRKSEQERQRGKVPDIHGAASDSHEMGKKANIWPAITVAVVTINLAILGYFWFQFAGDAGKSDPAAQPLAEVESPAVTPTPAIAAQPAKSAPSVATIAKPQPRSSKSSAALVQSPSQPELIESKVMTTDTESQHVPSVGYLPQLEELPAYERDGIPDMTFSSHMYSSISRFRSVIINGKRLKEGQYLNEQLQVREITESGVVLSRNGTLFEVDVLGRWAQ